VAINLAVSHPLHLLKDLYMSRNMAHITVAVLVASLEAIRGSTTEGRVFWEICFPELLIVKLGITE
jgi:hypothetical protein